MLIRYADQKPMVMCKFHVDTTSHSKLQLRLNCLVFIYVLFVCYSLAIDLCSNLLKSNIFVQIYKKNHAENFFMVF